MSSQNSTPITTVDWDDFAAKYQARLSMLSSKSNEAADHLSKVFVYLQSLEPKLVELRITYDGCGDSGQVEDIQYFDSKGQLLTIDDEQPLPDDIAQGRQHQPGDWVPGEGWKTSGEAANVSAHYLIDELAWDLAYGKHPGFEIDEGGCGTISITSDIDYPNQVRVNLSHSVRFIETTDYEYSF